MPDLGLVVDSDKIVCLHSGFSQRYERARWDKRIGWRRNEPCSIEEHQAGDLVFAYRYYLYISLKATLACVIVPIAKVP